MCLVARQVRVYAAEPEALTAVWTPVLDLSAMLREHLDSTAWADATVAGNLADCPPEDCVLRLRGGAGTAVGGAGTGAKLQAAESTREPQHGSDPSSSSAGFPDRDHEWGTVDADGVPRLRGGGLPRPPSLTAARNPRGRTPKNRRTISYNVGDEVEASNSNVGLSAATKPAALGPAVWL